MEENEAIIEVNKLLQKLTGSSVECLSLYPTCDFDSLLSALREAVSFVKLGQRDNYLDEIARSFSRVTGCSEEFWRANYANFLPGDRLVLLKTLCDLQGKAITFTKCEGATCALSIPLDSAEPKELLAWIEKAPISQEAKELCKRQVEGYANIVAAEEFGELLRSKGVKDEVVKIIYQRSQELGIPITDLINLFDFEGNIC